MKRLSEKLAAGLAAIALSMPATADEGLWLFNAFPKDRVEKRYGFKVSDSFLEHLRSSAVRFNNGGTGSFVSPDGLLFTNHHVGSDCIAKLSTPNDDLMKKGFLARSYSEERTCPDLEVNVLTGIEDVTGKVNAAVKEGVPDAEANRLRKAAMGELEKACAGDAADRRCDVVTLFSGGLYHLYKYKKYTDVRLVMAPEFQIAFFGGDPENFTYPRYNLDIAFFRAYENGKPAKPADHFKFARRGVKEGDLVFVPGHPGTTGRLLTMSQLEFSRDISYPLIYARLESIIAAAKAYSAKGEEQKRQAQDVLFGVENSYKAYTGFLKGLRDRSLMEQKQAEESKFLAAAGQEAPLGKVYEELAAAMASLRGYYAELALFETYAATGNDLLRIARTVLRYAEETKKPDAGRLREFRSAALPSLEQNLFSEAPLYLDLEEALLANYLRFLAGKLGSGHAVVAALLDGRTPEEAAKRYVSTTKLNDPAERKRLAKEAGAMESSSDGMIEFARKMDPAARALRKRYEDEVESVVTRAAAEIAKARFKIYGASEYPDATFTLRLAYGSVRGYKDENGNAVPFRTTLAGLFPKARNEEPYILPESWLKAKPKLNLKTPFNFVATADTHGGNSGSATLNTKGEVVGILFDGNLESLPKRFIYSDTTARSVHVSIESVWEALEKIYGAKELLKELR